MPATLINKGLQANSNGAPGGVRILFHPLRENVASFSLLHAKSRTSVRLLWWIERSSNPFSPASRER